MATNHTCIDFTDSAGRDFKIIKTKASNIKLVGFNPPEKIRDTTYYGMNASFYDTTSTNKDVQNIAYQDGNPVGSITGGTTNLVGKSIISWNGTSLAHYTNVIYDSSSNVPKTSGSWAQGGVALFLCDTSWKAKYEAQLNSDQVKDLDGGSARAGILINTNTKDVYLIASRILTTAVFDLRRAMMEYAGITDGGSSGYWHGMMVDGGRSTQLRGEDINLYVSVLSREVPQIISLKNKN
ncbi:MULTISPECIES: hypothetical protein [unclassified Sedimentibacter]|uniref:hypothetical protein n=1 Tax=unclassified Sedimentibacter TaxID=2649220 RepID=UPI0027E094D7|nr:hypothetical protein [Sedimentibacter sp. MB35-C1]WMJ77308.1 hypothetical protein RBQ61_17350 [Sedimentibacter sp. MB35-C1]